MNPLNRTFFLAIMLLLAFEAFSLTDARNRVVLSKDRSFFSQVFSPYTTYVIRYDFDLSEDNNTEGKLPAKVVIPKGCTLVFDGGSLRHGVVIGTDTRVVIKSENAFSNILLEGTWTKNDEGNLDWFEEENIYNRILANLNKLCNNINLNDREIRIDKEGLCLGFKKIYSPKEAIIYLHNRHSSDINGINLTANSVEIENVTIKEDFDQSRFPQNDVAAGVALGVYDPNKKASKDKYTIKLKNCKFSGSFSSSCFASSYISELYMTGCSFVDVIAADHLAYCSTNITAYVIDNIKIIHCQARTSLFKVRHASDCSVSLNKIEASNYKGAFIEYDEAFGKQTLNLRNLNLTGGSLAGGNLLYYGSGDPRCSFNVTINNLVWRQNENAKYKLTGKTTEPFHIIESYVIKNSKLTNTNMAVDGNVKSLVYEGCVIKDMSLCEIKSTDLIIKNCTIDTELNSGGLFRSETVKAVLVDNVNTLSQKQIPGFFCFKGTEPVDVEIKNSTFNKIGVNIFMATDTPIRLKMKRTKTPDATYDINYRGNIRTINGKDVK